MSNYYNAFLLQADYQLSKRFSAQLLRQAEDVYHSYPEIGVKITEEMLQAGIRRKADKLREKHQSTLDNSDYIGDLYREKFSVSGIELQLTGRKPTTALMIYACLIFSSQYKGLNTKEFDLNFPANADLISFANAHNHGKIPSGETLRRIFNKELSKETMELILQSTVRYAKALELDDFSNVIGDSTFVRANSRAASDFETLHILIKGSIDYLNQCNKAKVITLKYNARERLVRNDGLFSKYRHELRLQAKTTKEKDKVKAKILRQARSFVDWADKLETPIPIDCPFPAAQKLGQRLGLLESLIECLETDSKIDWAGEEKVLSLCDPQARWLVKGDRAPMFGYMAQVLTTPKGFISYVRAPHDNRSDKKMVQAMLEGHAKAMGNFPKKAGFDDGYSSRFNLKWCEDNKIKIFLKGSVASRITPEEEYNSDEAKTERNLRSRVEGYICRFKKICGLDRLSCRGQSNVDKEMLRKASFANILNIIDISNSFPKISKAA